MKKIILLLILIAGAFLAGRFFDRLKLQLKKLNFKPNTAMVAVVAVVCLLTGIFIGKGAKVVKNVISDMGGIGAPRAPLLKTGQLMVLCDFESAADIEKWQTIAAEVSLADEYVPSGKHSGKFVYQGGVQLSKAAIEKYFYRDRRLGDWEGYSYLLFDVYSLATNSERITLKIRDEGEKTFQTNIFVPSKKRYTVKVFLSEVKASVDISRVRQLNLFRWEAGAGMTVYVDNIRLVNDAEAQAAPPPTQATETLAQSNNIKSDSEPNIARVAGQKKLVYLLKPDLEKWRLSEGNPIPVPVVRFPAHISDPLKLARISAPATGGLPFAEGELKAIDNMIVVDKAGATIPFQAKATAYWPDGSIKWLLVDLQANVDEAGEKEIFIEYTKDEGQRTGESPQNFGEALQRAMLTQEGTAVVLNTGALKTIMSKDKFDLLGSVYVDFNGDGNFVPEELALNSGDMYVVHNNKRFLASLDKASQIEIEVEGQERTSVKRSGWFVAQDGSRFCKFILRVEAFKGKPYVRLYHTFIYTGYPENKFYERYEGLPLPKNETVQEFGILVPTNIQGSAGYAFGADEQIFSGELTKDIVLFQKDASDVSVNGTEKGKKSAGWIDLKGENLGVLAAVRYFWQQYPKAIAVNKNGGVIDIKLWPAQAGELDLRTTENALGPDAVARGNAFGLAKTHELYVYLHKPDLDYKMIDLTAKALTTPVHIRPDPSWLGATTVLGGVRQYDPNRFYDIESSLNDLFDWADRQPGLFNWYGMLNFGDTLSWYRMDGYDKSYDSWDWHPEGRWGWYNCEGVGTHSGALLQYIRTGRRKYFDFGENLTRHILDVDTCHYNTIENDPRLKGIIDDEVSQPGSMHRHNGDHWGGRNEEASHTNNFGILLYYYLTGYERAREVAEETGAFFLKGPITYTRHPDIAPQRSIANVLWGEMNLYETTRDERYKKAADTWAKLLVEGQNDEGWWAEGYNPMDGSWQSEPHTGYMVTYTLPALIQYHVNTKDEAVGNAIIKAADYLMVHEAYKAYYDSLAYSYWLTGDDKYRIFLEGYLKMFVEAGARGGDDLHRGMLFQKLIYHRPNEFLYSVPFAFLVLTHRRAQETGSMENSQKIERAIDPAITYSFSVVTPLYKIFPDSYELLTNKNFINISLAKNEYESAQLILHNANKKLKDVEITFTDLEDKATGEKIRRGDIEYRVVEYVKTKKPDYDVARVGFWPDPLTVKRTFDVERNSIQSIWVTIYASKDISAGNYQGRLIITPSNAKAQEISVAARIFDFELPNNSSFKTAFDLYPNRMKTVYPKKFQEEDTRYEKRLADIVNKYYDAMINFGVSPILNLNYPDPYFDVKVQDYLDKGISAFGIGQYGGSFDNNWPRDKMGLEALADYYGSFARHLKKKGWLDKAYIYTYDEPEFGDAKVSQVAAVIHQADPQLKNMICLMNIQDPRQYQDWVKDIDIFTIRNRDFNYDNAKLLKEMGKELWIYVSGPKPPFANLAIDFPAMSYRILPWMCWKYDVTGLLYWCVNFYSGDPWVNPMNTKWEQNGNGFLFYPGQDEPVPSLRLYVLRDGIEDYEYFKLLSDRIKEAKAQGLTTVNEDLVKRAERLLNIDDSIVGSMALYTREAGLILKRRQDIAQMIEEINKVLGLSS